MKFHSHEIHSHVVPIAAVLTYSDTKDWSQKNSLFFMNESIIPSTIKDIPNCFSCDKKMNSKTPKIIYAEDSKQVTLRGGKLKCNAVSFLVWRVDSCRSL